MTELPDPAESWSAALRRLWCAEPEFSMNDKWAGAWMTFVAATITPVLLPNIGSKMGLLWSLWQLPVLYLIWWRCYTRPRMPTIWEVLIGLLMFLVMPAVTLGRLLVHWVAESSSER